LDKGGAGWRWAELLFLFGGVPAALAVWAPRLALPVLLLAAPLCLASLLRDPSFPRETLLHWPGKRVLGSLALRAVAVTFALALAMLWLDRAHAFGLVRERPWLWLLIAVAYPVLSVVPQEVVFRSFFLHRYRSILGTEETAVVVSAVAFGAAHLVLHNWLAVVLTLVGGALFARTYVRTRSLPAVAWEHALYGVGLFTIGLGRYFVTRWVQPS